MYPSKSELIIKTKSIGMSDSSLENFAPFFFNNFSSSFFSLGISFIPIQKNRALDRSPLLNVETNKNSEVLQYYKVDAPEEMFEELLQVFNKSSEIEAAYIKPQAEPAVIKINNMRPASSLSPAVATPNLRNRQNYLGPSPTGINAQVAWNIRGGKGLGVNIIDIEWGWRFTHEDLRENQGGVIAGQNTTDDDHGTAVLGVFSGDVNNIGVIGISPEANVSAISLESYSTSEAILIAADKLQKGDIILIEVHRRGPLGHLGNNQFGYIGIEWWPDDFAAIQYATQKGIIVVEAAGNGGQNLDHPQYDQRPVNDPEFGTFPSSWENPFNFNNSQSGAIIVGAGMPPIGTHGRNSQPDWGDKYADRARCFFSNYGSRVDVQGWGWEVTTTGYGDLQGGRNKDAWYTDQFSGTSSASPMIVGVLVCLQGILKARNNNLLDSQQAISLLRNSGASQENGPGFQFIPKMMGSGYLRNHPARPDTERIGNRPDLAQLISMI